MTESSTVPNPLVRKLEGGAILTSEDRTYLEGLCRAVRVVGPRQDIIRENEAPGDVHLVMTGLACRYKLLPDGNRQNVALLLPGDFCDLHVAILGHMDHSVRTLSTCTIVDMPRPDVQELIQQHPRIVQALWWCTLVDEGTLREWLVNLGQREAGKRVAHLLCELRLRLQAVGLGNETGYDLPITQADLGDTVGIGIVHTNRVLQGLREAGLMGWKGGRVTIPDIRRLEEFCGFKPNYLHLRDRQQQGASSGG